MTEKSYDAIVIGAGPGGASCAALLAKKGLKTLLIEKNGGAGGKAMTVSKDGFRYELWPVTGGPRMDSNFESLLNDLGMEAEIVDPENLFTPYYRAQSDEFRKLSMNKKDLPWHQQQSIIKTVKLLGLGIKIGRWLGVGLGELMGLATMIKDIVGLADERFQSLDDTSLHEFLSRYNVPEAVYSFLAANINVLFVLPIDQVAASEALLTVHEMYSQGAGVYFKGGYGRIFEKCADAVEKFGGEVLMNTRVDKIEVREGRVSGVVTAAGVFNAPIVVSNAGIQPTVLKLVGKEHFESDYVSYVEGLVPSLGLMGIRYFLSEPVLDSAFCVAFSDDSYWNTQRAEKAAAGHVPDEMLVFATVPSMFDPDLAPEGKQCVLASTLCPADPEMGNLQAWWDKLDEMMARIWPDLPQHVESKQHYSTKHVSNIARDQVLPGIGGECIGLGQIVGQCGKHKPSAEAPVPGLFYVGCDAGGHGCGTHQGVTSGINVSNAVLQYHQKQKT